MRENNIWKGEKSITPEREGEMEERTHRKSQAKFLQQQEEK